MSMTLNDYQDKAGQYAMYNSPVYPFLGLAEEAGEVAGKIAKYIRKHGDLDWYPHYDNSDIQEAVAKELGDVLWMLAECASSFELNLEDIAEMNLAKLTDRKKRGVIKGEGDER